MTAKLGNSEKMILVPEEDIKEISKYIDLMETEGLTAHDPVYNVMYAFRNIFGEALKSVPDKPKVKNNTVLNKTRVLGMIDAKVTKAQIRSGKYARRSLKQIKERIESGEFDLK
jgi:hypothetical protein